MGGEVGGKVWHSGMEHVTWCDKDGFIVRKGRKVR